MKTRIVLHSFDELSFVIVPTQNGTAPPGNVGGSIPLAPDGTRTDAVPPIWLVASESARPGINGPLKEL
jgi:hypothetical protein